MAKILRIENLQYKEILKDINLELEEKTFNLLIGKNSSGKTTLVNCINQSLKYSGNILFNNQVIVEPSKQIGYFNDEQYFFENIIIEELLSFLKNLNYTEEEAKKRIYTLSRKLNFENILYKEYNELNINERTLVSFLFSVIHEPKILIIDNDLETLDENYKTKIFNYIKSQKKLTTLFITTNSNYFYLANEIFFLNNGKISLKTDFDNIHEKEKLLLKSGSNLPFEIELSNKLISYELLESLQLDIKKMVDLIWK